MYFKSLLITGVLIGLVAFSTAIPAPKAPENVLSAFQSLGLKGIAEDGGLLEAWKMWTMYVQLDNIKFFDSKVNIPTESGETVEVQFRNTHLRGIHRLDEGIVKVEEVSDKITIYSYSIGFEHIGFHSDLAEYNPEDGSFIAGMRSMASITNLKGKIVIQINLTPGALPIRIIELGLDDTFDVTVHGKTLNSQWGDLSEKSGPTMKSQAKIIEYLKSTYIPRLLRENLSLKTMSIVNQGIENIFTKQSEISKAGPFGWYDKTTFAYFWGYRKTMCDSYQVELNHTLEYGRVNSERITVKNGNVQGLEYVRLVECGSIEQCKELPCPTGSMTYNYDDIYIDYDIEAYEMGMRHTGKITVTISGLQQKDSHTCVTECPGFWCYTYPNTHSKVFTKTGKVLVDVEGLPDSLRPRHGDLIQFAEVTRAKLMAQISDRVYGTEHLDDAHCKLV